MSVIGILSSQGKELVVATCHLQGKNWELLTDGTPLLNALLIVLLYANLPILLPTIN